jgi:hypothetical protein
MRVGREIDRFLRENDNTTDNKPIGKGLFLYFKHVGHVEGGIVVGRGDGGGQDGDKKYPSAMRAGIKRMARRIPPISALRVFFDFFPSESVKFSPSILLTLRLTFFETI